MPLETTDCSVLPIALPEASVLRALGVVFSSCVQSLDPRDLGGNRTSQISCIASRSQRTRAVFGKQFRENRSNVAEHVTTLVASQALFDANYQGTGGEGS
jgi:hypothetical protein